MSTFYLFLAPVDEAHREHLAEEIRLLRKFAETLGWANIIQALQTPIHFRFVTNIRDLEPKRIEMTEPVNTTLTEGPDETGPSPIVITFIDGKMV